MQEKTNTNTYLTYIKGIEMALKIKNGETLLFIGDSITDCGRRGGERPLGCGYVKIFRDLLMLREPAKKVNIINKGIGGDNVVGLKTRWSDDVIRHKPDWLSIKIGINDLHGAISQDANSITPEVFRREYDNVLSRTATELPRCRIILIDPFFISADRDKVSFRHEVLNLLPAYIGVVHDMSRKYKTRLVKTHAMYQGLLKFIEAEEFCQEPVHPNQTGHLAIAEAVYGALSR